MTDMRMARELKMAEEDIGTRAERDRERRWWRTFVPIVLSGFVAGFAFALADQGETFLAGKIPPLIAVLIAGSYVVTMIAVAPPRAPLATRRFRLSRSCRVSGSSPDGLFRSRASSQAQPIAISRMAASITPSRAVSP